MRNAERFQLIGGPYRQPRYRVGQKLFCEVRGMVTVLGVSNAPIPWPMTKSGRRGGRYVPIVIGGLVKAIETEAEQAVAHWWGVSESTVWLWRKALAVPRANAGTSRLHRRYVREWQTEDVKEKARQGVRRPETRAKIAEAQRGHTMPEHVREAVITANLGRKLDAETREKMSEAHRARGTRPPKAGPAWKAKEERLLGKLPDREVARRIGRSLSAVQHRRGKLGIERAKG